MTDLLIRVLQQEDNVVLASIIRNALAEFGADKPGTVFFDPTTDHLYELFQHPGAIYFVAESNGVVQGGAGLFPSAGLPPDTCELVKMYLRPQARGLGLGGLLIQRCLDHAKETGFAKIYLETLPELHQAVKVYERFGFSYLDGPMGNTGHFGCDLWMLKEV